MILVVWLGERSRGPWFFPVKLACGLVEKEEFSPCHHEGSNEAQVADSEFGSLSS